MTGRVASLLITLAPHVLGFGSPFIRGLHDSGSEFTITSGYSVKRYFFSEVLSGDDKVVLLEEGPFKLEALCKTLTYTYSYGDYYDDDFSYQYSDSSYYSPLSHVSSYTSYPPSYFSSYTSSSSSFYTDDIAALDLTFTAEDEDYVYGQPNYEDYYSMEPPLVGPYEAGESRNMTVFEGRDGGYGGIIALRSTSGYYLSIPQGEVIGVHKSQTEYLYGGNSSFPEGVDCMLSGFIHYVAPV